jgi:two-component system chemotaxis response regulator CheB
MEPSPANIRVLVVDDSAVIRALISDAIAKTPGMEVVGTAVDGQHALAMFETIRPDVVTLDLQMPNLDGMAALDAMLAIRPVPVIIVSSLSQYGAEITLEALDRGAFDYVLKPDYGQGTKTAIRDELPRRIRLASGTDVRRILQIRKERKQRCAEPAKPEPKAPAPAATVPAAPVDACIALGISTGGPPALTRIFQSLRPPMPPIVVVQHMPPQFTAPLAWRLDSISALTILEATDGMVLRPDHVLIAPGGKHLRVIRCRDCIRAAVRDGPAISGHKPSVDALMTSAAEVFGDRCLGVIMTGMGRDGVAGCAAIHAEGGYVLGQDEASSDVYGMNRAAFVEGHVDRQFGLEQAVAVMARHARALRDGPVRARA